MKLLGTTTVLFVGLLFSNAGPAHVDDDFKPIFDGESLDGWSAPNMSYWSVEDGAITAESTEANPCTENQFLVWQDGEVADFDLELKFRLENNSGNHMMFEVNGQTSAEVIDNQTEHVDLRKASSRYSSGRVRR